MKIAYAMPPENAKWRPVTKLLLVMKLSIILLLAFTQVSASGYSQTFTLSMKKVSLETMINEIKKQTGYDVFYEDGLILEARPVDIKVRNVEVKVLLDIYFKDQMLDYVIQNKTIVITRKKAVYSPEINVARDTTKVVRGKVMDEKGEPLSGATVTVPNTKIGTSANANGEFNLRVPEGMNELIVSSIAHKDQIVQIKPGNIIVILKEMAAVVDDIVVIGYGAVKKSDVTGAVSSISKKDLGDRQVSDIASLIQGRAAGVDVSQGTIRIRGITTFNNTDPLVVIDGFIGGNLSTVNANDIENIEILKDASSTAIYGSRGANGVILITTKSGKAGPLKLNLSYYEGVSQVPKKMELLNANQYTDYVLDLLENSGIEPTPKILSDEVRIDRTDWQDEIFRTGRNRELNLDFSGGAENVSYFLGMGYKHSENPTFMGRADDNFYFRNKNTFTIKKWIRAGNNFAFTYNHFQGGGADGNPGNLDHTLTAPQYFPVKDENGNYSVSDRNTDIVELSNPINSAVNNHIKNSSINYQAALWAEVEPIKGLVYKIQAGVSGDFGRGETSNNSYTGGYVGNSVVPTRLSKTNYYSFSPLIEQYITYTNRFGLHDFSVMAGNTWQNGSANGTVGVSGQDLDLSISNVLTASNYLVTQDAIGKYAYLSYFGRINYQYANKYLLTLNIRTDASPRFAPGNRWGTFPSVAVAWKLHEEDFIKRLNVFDQLKLRGGWGLSGNDAIGEFRYLSQVYTNNVYYPFGSQGTRANGATVLNNASGDIQWESTETKSLGADMAFFKNKLSVTLDYYIKETSDILYEVPRASSLGYGGTYGSGSAIVNAASMENKGIELQLGYRSAIGQVSYSINANYTHNKNKVTSLGDGSYLDGVNRTDIGNPVGYFYGFVADGIFNSQKDLDAANGAAQAKGFTEYQLGSTRAGDVRFRDVNGDGHVDNDDRTSIGSPHPTHIFGVNLNLGYKGFDFNMFLQGINGSSIYDGNFDKIRSGTLVMNQYAYVLDRWQSETNPGNGIVPRAILGDPAQNNRASTLKLSDGNYLKLRQLSLGYSLSSAVAKRVGFDNIRIYASAYNYFTFTKYKYGYDPEVGGGNLNRAFDSGYNFPRPKMLIFGFQARL